MMQTLFYHYKIVIYINVVQTINVNDAPSVINGG